MFENIKKLKGKGLEYVKKYLEEQKKQAELNRKMEEEQRKKEEKERTKKQKEEIEKRMAEAGYFKGKMCPFVVAAIGGTHVATAVFTGGQIEEYTWKHFQCIEEYCRLWDKEAKECSFKVMAESFKKK
jgi:hypothetical protein